MNEDMRKYLEAYGCAILLMLLFFGVVGMVSENVRAGGSGDYPPPASGDWNVHNDTIVENETIILNGNLTVYGGATLTFRNVTLKMNSTSSQYYAIEILNGATFRIFDLDNDNTTTADASVIERNNSSNPYFFRVYDGSVFEMRNSELHGCGDATTVVKYAGLYIETDNATIDHNLISNNYMGIVLYGSDATVSNNTITWNNKSGIRATTWSNATIENNWITWNKVYGIWIDGWDNTHGPWPSNPIVINNIVAHTGRDLGAGHGNGIHITYASNPVIKNTQILSTGEDAIYSADGSTPTLINVTIDGANYGIATSSTRYIYL
jgi:parallel beta-helix repeat protein